MANATKKKTRTRVTLKHSLPAPKLSFEKHLEILKAYVVASKSGQTPVNYVDVGKLSVSPPTVSKNNKFFEEFGFIQQTEGERGKYLPTSTAIEIVKNLNWNNHESVKKNLEKLIVTTWFWDLVNNLIKIHNRRTEDDLLNALGEESGADPKRHMSSLKILLEYLTYVDLIKLDQGFYVIGNKQSNISDENLESVPQEPIKQPISNEDHSPHIPNYLIGILITPNMTEDKIRETIRIIKEELGSSTYNSE